MAIETKTLSEIHTELETRHAEYRETIALADAKINHQMVIIGFMFAAVVYNAERIESISGDGLKGWPLWTLLVLLALCFGFTLRCGWLAYRAYVVRISTAPVTAERYRRLLKRDALNEEGYLRVRIGNLLDCIDSNRGFLAERTRLTPRMRRWTWWTLVLLMLTALLTTWFSFWP